MTLAAFLSVALMHLMAAISPGPAVLMSARTGLTEGFRVGVFLAMGIGAGAVFWAASAMFGLAVLFKLAPSLLIALKLIGGAYLFYLGFHLWRDAATPFVTEDARPTPRSRHGGGHAPNGKSWSSIFQTQPCGVQTLHARVHRHLAVAMQPSPSDQCL